MKTRAALLLLALSAPLPVLAQSAVVAAAPAQTTLPVQLGPNARTLYRDIFTSIDANRWDEASAKLAAMESGPLHPLARAIIYTGKGSPRVEAADLISLATIAPDLPQAPSLVRMAASRGVIETPFLPEVRQLNWLGSSPRRTRTTTTGDPAAGWIAAQIIPLIKEDRPIDAEAVMVLNEDQLSVAARTEWWQRVAWSYFIEGEDGEARRVAASAQSGTGEWAAMGDWVAGLAAWRQRDYTAASASFTSVARRSTDPEMIAAGHYWGWRAETALKRPAQTRLQSAARFEETFYGMLAQAAMGLAPVRDDDGARAIQQVVERPNVRAALALAEIGEIDRADEMIRWQARIGNPADHATLTLIAGKLSLPQTQLYLAHNGPKGARTTIEGRYPIPVNWRPDGGWRVDSALVFAHALQESQFRPNVTSPAGARGLMQVMPATAQVIARRKGFEVTGSLTSPSTNMEYGQSYIEQLRDMASTGGLLPKVIAAYNCGPAPLERWNARDETTLKDPLLYIESIPYWETRGYVTIVLRNYWMYQQQTGAQTESRTALVQGIWPRFPGATLRASR